MLGYMHHSSLFKFTNGIKMSLILEVTPIPNVKFTNLPVTSSVMVWQTGISTVPQPIWRLFSKTSELTTPFIRSGTLCNANTGTAISRPRSMTPDAAWSSWKLYILSSSSTAFMIWIGLWTIATLFMNHSKNYPSKNWEQSTKIGYTSEVIPQEPPLSWQSTWTNQRCERPLTSRRVCRHLRFAMIRSFKITGRRFRHRFGSIRSLRTNTGSFITLVPQTVLCLPMEPRAGLRTPISQRLRLNIHGLQTATFLVTLLSTVTSFSPQSITLDTWHLSGRDQRWQGWLPSSFLSKLSTEQS